MTTQKPKRRLGDVRDVARERRCSVATVYRHAASGEIPKPIHIGGRAWWDLDRLDALIEAKLAERDREVA